MSTEIAIVGMACHYADARSPRELWENVLARRRAFRRMPPERLLLEDYAGSDAGAPDSICSSEAAVITDYEFDRIRFRVSGPAFRSADPAHWLALDVSDQALQDAGFAEGQGLPLETTAVLVGNTLTGEFSRASILRLRWPYVRRTVEAQLRNENWDDQKRLLFLERLEEQYKSAFVPVGEETLAGSLSNTIAGRICSQFHFGGGGYTVDGACCSSLLAVAQACSALAAGDVDAALAGGVDLSLDPFELIGFSRAGALTRGEMLVYDRQSSGFVPGEGSGFVVLMRLHDALARGRRIYACIRGWGVSSDGAGNIMRPDLQGQSLALQRAYARAGYGPETVGLFEGHGTGTAVGDEVELRALVRARSTTNDKLVPAALGSIKANIGHTKAAAGVAGLIKAALAVHHGILPPATGVRSPRPEIDGTVLRVLDTAEPWPEEIPVRAGVSSFGFGGINVHVTLEGRNREPNRASTGDAAALASNYQDLEVFFLASTRAPDLAQEIRNLSTRAAALSHAELADLAATLAGRLTHGRYRAAVVASTPQTLARNLKRLSELLEQGITRQVDADSGIFLGVANDSPRIGLLFPGQASPFRLHGGAHARRFKHVAELYSATASASQVPGSTHTAQVAIATAELAGMRLLSSLGIDAWVAVGHSLGEIAAYCWAGAIDNGDLLRMVDIRGRHMAAVSGPDGSMASVAASSGAVEKLLEGHDSLAIACFNSADQVVVAGASEAIGKFMATSKARGYRATLIPAAHAFHSPLMSPAQAGFRDSLKDFLLYPLRQRVISTITGKELDCAAELRSLLVDQLTAPVRFMEALAAAARHTDLFIEVGPGATLTRLVNDVSDVPAIAMDVTGPSLAGLLHVSAAAFVLGLDVRADVLFRERFTRPFDLARSPRFLANPCESIARSTAVRPDHGEPRRSSALATQRAIGNMSLSSGSSHAGALEVVQQLVSHRTELPLAAIGESANLLRDFHLNSITVAELVAAAAREMGMNPPRQLLDFAGSTVGEVAKSLERLRSTASGASPDGEPVSLGIDDWCRAFDVRLIPRALSSRSAAVPSAGEWRILAAPQNCALVDGFGSQSFPGRGVLVVLSPDAFEEEFSMLLEGAQSALFGPATPCSFVLVGDVSVAASFARSLHLENPEIATRVIHAPLDSRIGTYIREEVSAPGGHVEAHYDGSGCRTQPFLRLLPPALRRDFPLHRGDVVVVSGGGKGIVADCALALSREMNLICAILGRSLPSHDKETADTISAFASRGLQAKYFPVDVTDQSATQRAVAEIEELLGPVSGIIHGAGCNEPKLVRNLTPSDISRTLAPKMRGLRNLIAAVDPEQLRLLLTFSSVIGLVGLRGEAHYALANASLSKLTKDFAEEHPACHCIAFESTAWSELGMAERLGTVEALRRDGVHAITPQQGVSALTDLVSRALESSSVVVTGRLGAEPPLPIDSGPMPLLRFLERTVVNYPGVELVADCDVSAASDPYLLHHVFQGQPLLPAVIGLESMTQAAMAVTSEERLPVLRDIRFDRPLACDPGTHLTLRVAALVREPGVVEVVLRSSRTGFHLDHFRCFCSFNESNALGGVAQTPEAALLPISPARDLYGGLLFQAGWFRRLGGYRHLSASGCWAEITPAPRREWFSQYLPSTLLLGDPGARDAALHSVQACIPQATVLPVKVKRFCPGSLDPGQALFAHATEECHDNNSYTYNLELRAPDGRLCELWEGLELRKVAETPAGTWPEPLAAAFLEWRVRNLVPTAEVSAVFDRDHSTNRRDRSRRATGLAIQLRQLHRPSSGVVVSPEQRMEVSTAHAEDLTLAVAGQGSVACDLEAVRERPEQVWCDLLGKERWNLAQTIAREFGQDVQAAATEVWTAQESLKKASAPHNVPLVLLSSRHPSDGVSLGAAGLRIASSVIYFRDHPTPFAVSILVGSEE